MRSSSPRSGCRTRAAAASTVSLLERQVEVLRERNRQLERKVKDFVDVARENDALGTRVLAMARRLIAVPRPRGRDRRASSRRCARISAPGSRCSSSRRPRAPEGMRGKPFSAHRSGRMRRSLRSFDTLFSAGKPALRPAARLAARVPVRRRRRRNRLGRARAARAPGEPGLLACGSNDSQRFNPTMSTDFWPTSGS